MNIDKIDKAMYDIIVNDYNVNPPRALQLIKVVDSISLKCNIDPLIVYAMIAKESSFRNILIRWDVTDYSVGYMQIHKSTYNYVRNIFAKRWWSSYKNLVFNWQDGIIAGVYYLYIIQHYWKRAHNDIWYAVSIYNGNKEKYSMYMISVKNIYDRFKNQVKEQ